MMNLTVLRRLRVAGQRTIAVLLLALALSPETARRSQAQDAAVPGSSQVCGHRHVSFDYTDKNDNEKATYPSISFGQKQLFEKTFCNQVVNIENYFLQQNWWMELNEQPKRLVATPETYIARRGTFDAPYPKLYVITNSTYDLSESLVPAFYGHRGRMQFPQRRVAVNEAAIAHELTHVFFPNSNRMLAEGLAVWVQSNVSGLLAYPTFEQTPDQQMAALTCGSKKTPLDAIHLAGLDQVTTPSILTLRILDLVYGVNDAHPYSIAGSFVGYLIATYGVDLFHQLYVRTPLVPLERDAGNPERWQEVYGFALIDLEKGWKAYIERLGCPP